MFARKNARNVSFARSFQPLRQFQHERFSTSRSLFEQKVKTETEEKITASVRSEAAEYDEKTVKELSEAEGTFYPYSEVQATGIERAARQFGDRALFPDEYPRFIEPGDRFIMVPTFEPERTVGCAGLCEEGVPSGYRFWSMKPGQKATCTACGRRFYCYNPEQEYEKQVKLEKELEQKGISMARYHLMKLTEERRVLEDLCKKHGVELPEPAKQLPEIEKFSEEQVLETLKSVYDVQESELEQIVQDTAVLLETLGEENEHLLVQ